MALAPRILPVFDINTGETFIIEDLTGQYNATNNTGGYGGPNIPINSVNATRFVFSSYVSEQQATTTSTIVAGYEYLVGGSGSFTYDTKTYAVGDTFISQVSGTPTLSNCTLTQTGRFSPVLGFLPAQVTTSSITPSLTGEDATIFADTTHTVDYEIYTTVYGAGVLRPAGTYVVINNTVTIGGATYRIGEQFTRSGTFTTTGSGSIVLLYDSISRDFVTQYYAFQAKKSLELRIANSCCGCKEDMLNTLRLVETKYSAIEYNFTDNLGLSFSGVQSMLEDIVRLVNIALNCNC